MSIQIPFSRDDLSLRRAGTIHDLFNPNKHNLWLPGSRTPMLVQSFHNILSAIISRENVNNFDEFFIPLFLPAYRNNNANRQGQPNFIQFVKDVVAQIPDQHLWTLPFILFTPSNQNVTDVHVIRWTDYTSGNGFSFTWDETRRHFSNTTASNTDYTSPLHLILDFCERFNTYWDANSTRNIAESPMTWHPALEHLFRMLRGRGYATLGSRGDGSGVTPINVQTAITNSPEATVEIQWTNGGSPWVSVKVPITYSNRHLLYQVFQYTQDVTTMLNGPRKLKSEGTPVYIGVELELTTNYTINNLIDATKEPFFIAKQDSSISGSKPNRMELVTVPGSFKYLKQQYALWFNNLEYDKFDCTTNTSNGMHVHVDRKAFDDDYHIRNFCWFINNPANTPFIVAMSDRGSLQAMQHYTPFLQFPNNSTRTTAFKKCHRLIEGHRGATNLKGGWAAAKTVEVRIFKGIVSYTAIVKNLEFVESVFHFTQSLRSYREMSLSAYIDWLFKTPTNRFSILKKFIENQDIEKFLITADVKDIIFNESDPEKIAQMLIKSGIKLTNDHVSFLNKGQKRTFTLDKDSGVLNVLKTNIFKLANLDVDLAKRFTRTSNAA